MKILIVEDEPEARDGLERLLISASADWVVLPPCADGASGLEAARRYLPDIIITDIRMPGQDGLAMVEKLRHVGNSAAVIVLSGYPDFDYARRCLALGVQEYILKPVTASRLVEVVQNVEARVFDCGDLKRLLADPAEQTKDGVSYELGVLVQVRSAKELQADQRQIVRREVRHLFGRQGRTLCAAAQGALWFYVESASLHHPPVGATGFGRLLAARLGQSVAVCGRQTDFDSVRQTALLLAEDVKRFLLGSVDNFLAPELSQDDNPVQLGSNPALESRISEAIREKRWEDLSSLFHEYVREAYRPGFDPTSVIRQTQRFLFTIQNYLKDLGPKRFRRLLDLNPIDRLAEAVGLQDVHRLFQECAEVISAAEIENDVESTHPRITAALAIIADRLADPPSLGILADELGLNVGYLSRLFKQEVGEGYARYVMRRRIEYAASLLVDKKLSIAVVAGLAGFQNSKYFFEVFRHETGLSPTEYRTKF